MAGVWCLHRNWRKDGNCYFCNQKIFHLYYFSDPWFTRHLLFIYRFLDEREKLYSEFPAQSFKIPLTS